MSAAEEAIHLPGFRWFQGMRGRGRLYWKKGTAGYIGRIDVMEGRPCVITKRVLGKGTCEATFFADDPIPDPDDPGTAGCLFALLGTPAVVMPGPGGVGFCVSVAGLKKAASFAVHDTLGRACLAAALELGRWPGGEL